jgi:hypothetical protein
MVFRSLFTRVKKSKKFVFRSKKKGDLIEQLSEHSAYYARHESILSHKPVNEVIEEIILGLKIVNLELTHVQGSGKSIILIPPKYEFWTYFLTAAKLSFLGYKTIFVFHNWSRPLIDLVKDNVNYIRYHNLSFENVEDYKIPEGKLNNVLNFSDGIKYGSNNIPSFSTAIITDDCDLDYVLAYVISNAFSFAGMKSSNVKRLIVDESIKDRFRTKLKNRFPAISVANESKIRSENIRKQIHSLISDGISEGAELIFGNSDYSKDNYSNIVFDNVGKDMRIFQKSFYGPVLLITYTAFDQDENGSLKKNIKQQPSKGILVFSNKDLAEINMKSGKEYIFVKRPSLSISEYSEIIEYNPTLEAMFYILGVI